MGFADFVRQQAQTPSLPEEVMMTPTDYADARVAELGARAANDNPWLRNMLIGMGRAFKGVGQSVTQLGLAAGNAVGLVSDDAEKNYNERVRDEARTYEALAGDSIAARVGEIGTQVGLAVVPAAGYGGAVARLSTLPRMAAYSGIGAVENQVLLPTVTDSPVEERLGNAAMGLLGGPVGVGMEAAVQGLRGLSRALRSTASRMTTPEFETQLQNLVQMAGVDWRQLPPQMQQEIATAVRQGADEARLMDMLEGMQTDLSNNFPYTDAERRYLGGEKGPLALQNDIANGVYGDEAATRLNRWENARQGLLGRFVGQRVDDVAPDLAGNRTPMEAGRRIFDAIEQQHAALTGMERQAWDELRNSGPAAILVNPQEWQALHSELLMAARAAGNMNEHTAPMAHGVAQEIMERMRAMGKGIAPDPNGRAVGSAAPTMYGVDALRELRAMMQVKASDPNSGRIIGDMRRAFDAWMEKASADGRITVQDNAVEAWRRARMATATLRNFDSGTVGGRFGGELTARSRIVQDVVSGRITPEALMQRMFGASGSNANSAIVIREMLQTFGADSAVAGAMRQGALLQIFGDTLRQDGSREVLQGNGGKFINRVLQSIRMNRSGLLELFGPDELKQWETFVQHLQHLSAMKGDPAARNLSGTAYAGKRIDLRMRDWLLQRMERFNTAGAVGMGAMVDPTTGMLSMVMQQQIRQMAQRARGGAAMTTVMQGAPTSAPGVPLRALHPLPMTVTRRLPTLMTGNGERP